MLRYSTVFFAILFFSCSEQTAKWPANGTLLEAAIYNLNLSDSSRIITKSNEIYTLLSPADSLIMNKDTIEYSIINKNDTSFFKDKADQQVIHSSDPQVKEYYQFKTGNILFLGFSSGNPQKPYTIFDPPLIISTPELKKGIQSNGIMKTFITSKNFFEEGLNAHLKIRKNKQINLTDGNSSKIYSLRIIIFSRDAVISYGQRNLTIPQAVVHQSTILIDPNGLPLAEWSIKTKKIENSDEKENLTQINKELYLEFTKYKIIKK